tara:strand:+ start:1170 stop:1550 length:381 start_codon:yes stop_codon:yes gene_type:complete
MEKKMNPFEFLNSINTTKKNLITDSDTEKEYNPFLVNRGLSNFIDTVFVANEMNQRHFMDKKMQYDFLRHIVRKRKRFAKWNKPVKSDDLDAVKEYFGYNNMKATEALKILSPEDLSKIHQKINTR